MTSSHPPDTSPNPPPPLFPDRITDEMTYLDAATGDIVASRAPADASTARPASAGTKASATLVARAQAQTNTQHASFMVTGRRSQVARRPGVLMWFVLGCSPR